MTRFQKFQIYCGIFLPLFGSVIVFFATMFELVKKKAGLKYWGYLFLIFFGFGLLATLVPNFLMSSETPLLQFLQFLVTALIMLGANVACVYLQCKCPAGDVGFWEKIPVKWIVLGAVVLAVMVGAFTIVGTLFGEMLTYEDLNGAEDASLNTITSEMVLENNRSSTLMSHKGHDGNSTKAEYPFKEYDWDECRFGAKQMHGVMTLQATKIDTDRLTIKISSELKSGNAEFFVIIDGQITERVPASMPDGKLFILELENIAGKTVVVKLAGESAEIEVKLLREYT